MTTATIESTLVQLEGLVNGYQELLAEAQAQLETLDVDDAKIQSLASHLTQDARFRTSLATETGSFIMKTTANEEESSIIERVADRIYSKILTKIDAELETTIQEKITALKDSDAVEQKILQMLAERKEFVQLMDMAEAMHKVITLAKELD